MSYTGFKEAYIATLLWSEIDDADLGGDGDNFDGCECQLDDDALAAIDSCCGDFWQTLVRYEISEDMHNQAGQDFCLTRNRHGCGFWDGDWAEPLGEQLAKAADAYGPMLLVRIDDDTVTVGG